ncbi:MAG: crossover junction endodeoxyribonuclease RuvC [Bacteroidia bacterium]|nr:crossover junction endodeoxyribonuclease RuvC [Bacteroidia bacterium]MDW8347840.1 crossover junction endodeoxyribonuclease RuvC [Bacteroidia bacterium]
MSKIIMGIDPGTQVLGYGVIEVEGNKNMRLLVYGAIRFNKSEAHIQRLSKIYQRVSQLLQDYKPDEFAIESPFYGKNIQAMLNLGRGQGVAIAAALNYGLTSISEYAPRKIKQAVTGNGSATKEQVLKMLCSMLEKIETPDYLDASDAIAVAVCHFFNRRTAEQKSVKSYSSWRRFVEQNPERVK